MRQEQAMGRRARDPPLGSVGRNAGISCLFSVNRKSSARGCKKGSATLPGLFLAMPSPCLIKSTPVTKTVPHVTGLWPGHGLRASRPRWPLKEPSLEQAPATCFG